MANLSGLILASICAGISAASAYLLLGQALARQRRILQDKFPLVENKKILRHSVKIRVNGKLYRIVYLAHKLGPEIPLVVFVHGLGAQIAQFDSQISQFSQNANVLAIDLLGHGESDHSSRSIDYSMPSLAKDLYEIFMIYRLAQNVLVGHSMGCAVIALLYPKIKLAVSAVVCIGPRYQIRSHLRWLGYVPVTFLDLYRYFDQRQLTKSASVSRFLSAGADDEVRAKQFAINIRSSTYTLTRILQNVATFPLRHNWEQIDCPVLLIVGEEDRVNPMSELIHLKKILKSAKSPVVMPHSGHNPHVEVPGLLNAVILKFLTEDAGIRNIDPTVQLLELSNAGYKWSMKNYEKWKSIPCVSSLVGDSKFVGMKVMREGDDEHSPKEFARRYPEIGLVVDISKDEPPYVTSDVRRYVKLPTESKIPPSTEPVTRFIQIVEEFWEDHPNEQIAVHCHYGFNRTGFLICSYMILVLNYPIDKAIEEYEKARAPGIKHPHFKNELFLRYHR